nr:E-beta-farnesene synthase [Tanacetum cinerariifolium]
MIRSCLTADRDTSRYICQLDEQWFDLTKDTLKDALQITQVNNNNPFSSPPTLDALINFVNNLGYSKVVKTLSAFVTNDMFQPWRALTTIINLCLTGKTSAFERPRAPVLQILWGIVNRAHIDYAKRIKHKFHLRPDSPLHIPYEEYILGYLKFSAEGTKRKVFGMPILNELITADIQGSDPDSPAPKPVKATKKSKPSAPKAAPVIKPAATKASKSTSSQQSKPKSAPAKTQEKKRKLVTETSDDPSLAKSSKPGLVTKRYKPTRSLSLVDEFVDEGIPENEPRFDDEEADMQRAVEESLKSDHDVHRGPLPPVVFREPDSGKFQPLPEVQGKGKEKVSDEQVALDLLTLQTPKKPQPQSSHVVHAGPNLEHMDLEATDVSTQQNPEQMDKGFTTSTYPNVHENLKLTVEEYVILKEPASFIGTLSSLRHLAKDFSFDDQFFNDKPSETENEKTTTKTEAESMVSVAIHQDTSVIPPMTSPVIDLISKLDSPNDHRPQLATATATTTTTITTLPLPPQPQYGTTDSILIKCIGELEQIMANLIQDNKHLEERLDSHGSRLYKLENLNIPQHVSKVVDEIVINAVDWAIQAPLRNRFRDFPEANMKEILHQRIWETNSYKAHEDHMMLYEALEKSTNHDHTDELLTDLAEAQRKKKKRHDSPKTPHGSPPHQPPPPPPPAGPSETSGSSKASGSSQLPHPPPPLSTSESDQSKSTAAPSSSKTAVSAEYTVWTTTDTRLKPSVSLIPEALHMDDDTDPDEQVHSSDDEDTGNAHIPNVNFKQDWWKPFEEDRPVTPEPVWSIPSSDLSDPTNNWASALASTYTPPPENPLLAQTCDTVIFMDRFCKKQGITELKPQDLEGLAFDLVKVFHPNVIHLQYQMEECHKPLTKKVDESIIKYNVSKPLPLGGPPGQVTIQFDFLFNKYLEYLRYGSKGGRPALSILKMKATYYLDVGLEKMMPDQMWIEEECKYDIAAIAVWTYMQILSVVIIEFFSMYGYDYMKKIVLHRVDLNEHIIAERDFKYLYPSDFEDLYLLNLQDHLNHLPPKDKNLIN